MDLEQLIGNEENKQLIEKILKSKNILHNYMFVGKEGIGKKEFAKYFAKKILCLSEEKNCNCKSCLEFESENHPDFLIIEPETNVIKIEQIRNLVAKGIEKPIIGSKKVYIINDANLMTKEAQNCLLKTLEEPPQYLVIILITENESSILTTIKSRCTKISFIPIEKEILKGYLLKNKIFENIDDERLNTFDGSIGTALNWKANEEIYEETEEFVSGLETKSKIDILNNQNAIYKNKENILDVISYMITLFYMKIKQCNDGRLCAKYINCIEISEDTKRKLKSNGNFDMCIDNMLLSICETIKN